MATNVYLLEANLDLAKKISDTATGAGYRMELVSDLRKLSDYIEKKVPDAVCIGYEWIRESLKKLNFLRPHFTIIYGENIDTEDRLYLYRQGIARIIELPENEVSILFHALRTHKFRERELKPLLERYVTRGKIQESQLREILFNSVLEKRNLIIKLQDGSWMAKLRIFQGEMVEAVCPGLSGLEAVLEILQHHSGNFRMQSFYKSREYSAIYASTYAMIAESDYEARITREFLEKFEVGNPIFQKSDDIQTKNLSSEELRLLDLVDRGNDFRSIVNSCSNPVLKTIRNLDKLYQKGAIFVDVDKINLNRFTAEDVRFIRDRLFKNGAKEGRLFVMGFPSSGKSDLLKTLAKIQHGELKSVQSLEFVHLQMAPDLHLNVMGISIDSYFQPLMEKLSSNMLACFFVVDASQQEKMEYTKYLIHQFLSNYQVPLVIALTNVQENPEQVQADLRERLNIPLDVDIVSINPHDILQIRRLFYHLKLTSPVETG